MGRSTGSEVWALLGGLALGLALSGALRWGPRFRRLRPVLLGFGLNLAAFAALGAILAAGTEPGGLGAQWRSWTVPSGLALAVGFVAFRFPRSVALPLGALAAVGLWLTVDALREFHPLAPATALPRVQPLSDRETVTAFAYRTDVLESPLTLPGVAPALYRFRPGDAPPGEWWWTWAVARGWARSVGAPIPEHPLKYGVYRLTLTDTDPQWRLERPELAAPDETGSP